MAIVVSDTSPIRALVFVELLDLLPKLFGRVIVPPAVAFELLKPARGFESINVENYRFIEVVAPTGVTEVARLRQTLDRGESEALILAKELQADVILIDELAGRATAKRLDLHLIGTLGVLLRAKKIGQLEAIRPIVIRLIEELNFFVSQELLEFILQSAGES